MLRSFLFFKQRCVRSESLYERIGGKNAVEATVEKLYARLLSDPLLAPFFENTDMKELHYSQAAFVTMAFGGPSHYKSLDLRAIHFDARVQGLSHSHFDATLDHLCDAMRELGVHEDMIAEASIIVDATRADILNL